METEKQRIIQEYVPGKQITLAHIIARPDPSILSKIGLEEDKVSAVGIMTITPSEAAIIASDIVLKAANTEIGYVDRFNGSLVITGLVSDVESSLQEVTRFLSQEMGFTPCRITRS